MPSFVRPGTYNDFKTTTNVWPYNGGPNVFYCDLTGVSGPFYLYFSASGPEYVVFILELQAVPGSFSTDFPHAIALNAPLRFSED